MPNRIPDGTIMNVHVQFYIRLNGDSQLSISETLNLYVFSCIKENSLDVFSISLCISTYMSSQATDISRKIFWDQKIYFEVSVV